jgi:tight adherence protein C
VLGIVGALLLGGAVFYIVFTMQVAAETSAAKDRLGLNFDSENSAPLPAYIRFAQPLLRPAYIDIALGLWKPEHVEEWKKKIRSAGLHRQVQAEHVIAAKFWLTLVIGVFMLLIFLFSQSPPPLWFAIGLIAMSFFWPNLDMHSRRTKRQSDVRLALPYVMDLLTLSMEAGLEFMGAISRVVERAPSGALIEELSELLKDIQLGKTRSEALRKMAQAIDMSELTSLVAVLVSADQMGVSIGSVLRAQADTIRNERLVKAEKLGAQASQKILIPLVFFILPAVFLMIFGPIILGMLGVKA